MRSDTQLTLPYDMEFREISREEALSFVVPRHYAGRKPNLKYQFGWFLGGELKAALTIGKPASPWLCSGVCGPQWSSSVYEINRVCRTDDLTAPLSRFVALCLKAVKRDNLILVSYADTEMHHTGFLYQATNFIYTGKTVARTDRYTPGNRHSRHYDKEAPQKFRKVRSSKHRYVYFAFSSKKLRKQARNDLQYPVLPYPKTDNKYYKLGEFLKPNIIPVTENGEETNEM